jgi:hypothetical protein
MQTKNPLAAGCALAAALLIGVALAGDKSTRAPPATPDALRVAGSQVLLLHTRATGVQIYACAPAAKDRSGFEWQFKAPQADLFDEAGVKIGTHYAGPTWELVDGSKVVGEVLARDDGPDVTAIPWLLLSVSTSSGIGALARTVHIRRMNTIGGKAPATGCTTADAGREIRVPYSASYFFYATGS